MLCAQTAWQTDGCCPPAKPVLRSASSLFSRPAPSGAAVQLALTHRIDISPSEQLATPCVNSCGSVDVRGWAGRHSRCFGHVPGQDVCSVVGVDHLQSPHLRRAGAPRGASTRPPCPTCSAPPPAPRRSSPRPRPRRRPQPMPSRRPAVKTSVQRHEHRHRFRQRHTTMSTSTLTVKSTSISTSASTQTSMCALPSTYTCMSTSTSTSTNAFLIHVCTSASDRGARSVFSADTWLSRVSRQSGDGPHGLDA